MQEDISVRSEVKLNLTRIEIPEHRLLGRGILKPCKPFSPVGESAIVLDVLDVVE